MSAGQQAASGPSGWNLQPHHTDVHTRGRVRARARRPEDRENSLGLIITTSLFLVLFAAAVLVGGHAVIAPLMHRKAAAQGTNNSTGDIVFTMPDGVFCRHLSFDNATGDITDGGVEECPDGSGAEQGGSVSQFRWGASR